MVDPDTHAQYTRVHLIRSMHGPRAGPLSPPRTRANRIASLPGEPSVISAICVAADSADVLAAERSFIELGAHLSALIGPEGYRALLARALHLASDEFALLSSVRPGIAPPGRLVGLRSGSRNAPTAEVHAAVDATMAALLAVLEQFIGADLLQGVLREIWPRLYEAGAPVRSPRAVSA